ncbi:MAG: bifunctional DNA-binding transcriptional regulator/O6-methylguanine-DNA methyltransferase Ada [Hyphomicrobium sp.]|nr:bifunctional DNA-binding transcriptional regulator/O6-methylguanine-DNA methyltransferase Ada [Hyphomicrobium sp.]
MSSLLKKPLRRPPYAGDDARWAAIQKRDAGADGNFYYSVASTGVYCRPSCASRQPKRENVAYHATSSAAEAAGFRACKRCKPDMDAADHGHAGIVAAACRTIEDAGTAPALAGLARDAGLSPFHFHRVFVAMTGVTPKAYASAQRTARVQAGLKTSATITDALYDAGYTSSGRFYAVSERALGMTPSAYKAGGADVELKFAAGECSLGAIVIAATDKGIAAILLGDDASALLRDLQDRFPRATLTGGDKAFETLAAHAIAVVDHKPPAKALPLDVRGTAFQHKVWSALQGIPPGKTSSYSDVAKAIGMPKAARAVALACAANPVAVVIPCHRVVRTDGALSGYRWGISRKKVLLAREANCSGRSAKRCDEK